MAETFGPALERLARAYEADPELRRDLIQDIHAGLWRSLSGFDGRCSLRTWVYRVAHNIGATHVIRQRRSRRGQWVGLEELEAVPDRPDSSGDLERLLDLVQRLEPLERQVILSYLEGLDAAAIGEITGISPANVATRIHRIKRILARWFREGGQNAG